MSQSKFGAKLAQIRAMMAERRLDAVKIALQKNVSWLIGGRSHVNTASEPACCFVVITRNECYLIASNIEAQRLAEEEFAEPSMREEIVRKIWPWHHPAEREAIVASLVAKEAAVRTDTELEGEFVALRTKVLPDEVKHWEELGQLTADAIEQTAMDISRGMSEYAIAGRLAANCWDRGLEPVVNLIAADERAYTRRHPLPTAKTVDAYVMLVVCARRNGMIASATRLVHFGPIPEELQRKIRAVAEIDARIIDATRPGIKLDELYERIETFYRDAGYPEEVRFHHQGGLTGYATRERISTPHETFVVGANQMFAWNPSIAGVKSEDTIRTTEGAPQILTASGRYPTIEVEVGGTVWRRPGILQR